MNKFLQKVLSIKLEDSFANIKNVCLNFINLHPEVFSLILLTIACMAFLFLGLGSYPLIDVDETRYAVMARDLINSSDWNSLMLNQVPFLEKPPLYFWTVGASVKLFGEFSSFAVRLPIALFSSFLVFFTYYVGKRIISRKFGLLSALILISSIFFLILAHVAILDMLLTVFVASALYSAFLTHFCEEKNKKYYWWLFYLFMSLGFLSKGILAFAIPMSVMFVYNLITRTLKDMFKPVNLLPGFVAFLAIITPWHVLMYEKYGYIFVRDYFLLHHFARFINSVSIGRERPVWYFIPVFLLGFMPWAFVFVAFLCDGVKKLVDKFKKAEGSFIAKLQTLLRVENNEQKMILFSTISFVLIFLLFSSSSTKLPTYILPVFPFASLLTGYYWWVSAERCENTNSINNSTMLFSAIFILAGLGASIAYSLLPYEIQYKLSDFASITALSFCILGIFLILRLNTKKALSVFSGYVFTMFFVIALAVFHIFNFVYSTGENELVDYSSYIACSGKKPQLVTFDFAVKPSVMINYKDKVNFITDPDFKALDEALAYKKGSTFVIIKNKNMKDNTQYQDEISKRLVLNQFGERYSLYTKRIKK